MARVQLDEPTRADIEKTKLSLELSSERGVRSFDYFCMSACLNTL